MYKADLSQIRHYNKNKVQFVVMDGKKIVFQGDARIPQHNSFLMNVLSKLSEYDAAKAA